MLKNEDNRITNKDGFSIAFSDKRDGNMSYLYGNKKEVDLNRAKFFERLGVNHKSVYIVSPTHSSNIEERAFSPSRKRRLYKIEPIINCDFPGYYTGADGCLTFDDKFIAILTGDCIPLIFWHQESNLHGIIHTGLLGAVNGIVNNLPLIYDRYGFDPATVNIYFGPSIKQQNYDLSVSGLWKVIQSQVENMFPDISNYLVEEGVKKLVDVNSIVREQLIWLGSNPELISEFEGCTADIDSIYFSHFIAQRGATSNGRFFSVIGPTKMLNKNDNDII